MSCSFHGTEAEAELCDFLRANQLIAWYPSLLSQILHFNISDCTYGQCKFTLDEVLLAATSGVNTTCNSR